MTLAGTRPPLVSETELYELHHYARLSIKPGITGLWQISGRSDITDFEEVVRLDREYIDNWNVGMDIKILLKVIVTNINASIDSVLLPTMSSAQDDKERVKQMTRRAIKTSTYVMAPLMMGLAFCAEPIVSLVLTDKWLPCVPFLRIFCITYMFWPVHTANLNAINAMGRSDWFLRLEIIKKIMTLQIMLLRETFGYKKVLMLVGLKPQMRRLALWY